MSNLFTKLGSSYVANSFGGSYFTYEGALCAFMDVGSRGVRAHKYTPEEGRTSIIVPADYFTSFEVFKNPPLGYRNYFNSAVMWESTRSTMRGFRPETIQCQMLDVGFTEFMPSLGDREAHELMYPNFISYHEGVASILNGDRFSFAMNRDVAVRINPEANPVIELLFRGRQAGNIDENGVLTLTNKVLRNSKTYSKLQGVAV